KPPADTALNDNPAVRRNDFFDWSESLRLSKHKPDLATDMLKMLIASLPETRESLIGAFEKDDMKDLLEITHKLHGGCCYCGVPALRAASKSLEEKLHKQDYVDLK